VIVGLGVDDVYIILLAIKKQGGYTKKLWLEAMKEVAVPVTMTSLVNASVFAVMNLSDIPAVVDTSRIGLFVSTFVPAVKANIEKHSHSHCQKCVVILYLSVLLCFPAICYLDLQRQKAGRMDILICLKSSHPPSEGARAKVDFHSVYLFDRFFQPIVLGKNKNVRYLVHVFIFLISVALLVTGAWGITQREVGLGLEDFFPSNYAAGRWATIRTEELAAWAISMHWGALNYSDPKTQMKMIKQFEGVVSSPYVAHVDTKLLWMADFAMWTSRHCTHNFDREDFDERKCGRDRMFTSNSYCAGTWILNEFGLQEKIIQNITDDTCVASEGGICRPGEQMHIDDLTDIGLDPKSAAGQSFCPVVQGWSEDKWKFCLQQWRNITGAGTSRFVVDSQGSPTECSGVYNRDENITWPLPHTEGPVMFAVNLYSHQLTLDMLTETRAICDSNEELHCWMAGIPFEYWSQYEGIFGVLFRLTSYVVAGSFAISFFFLFAELSYENNHPTRKIAFGSLIGSFLIAVTIVFTLVPVIGLSILAGVSLTGFSVLAFILCVGFAVEYSVHIVSRWMRADMSHTSSLERMHYTMSCLMLPTFLSFISSTIGVVCLAFTNFEFNLVYFFRPLMIVMFASYWFGCWSLPALLIYIDWDVVKLGKPQTTTLVPTLVAAADKNAVAQQASPPVADVGQGYGNDSINSSMTHPDPPVGPMILVTPTIKETMTYDA
jgi:hypothetical protein